MEPQIVKGTKIASQSFYRGSIRVLHGFFNLDPTTRYMFLGTAVSDHRILTMKRGIQPMTKFPGRGIRSKMRMLVEGIMGS